MKPDAPVAVDLFAGAGGLAEGLLRAGIDVALSVELHPQAGLTHAFNHPGTRVLVGDVRNLDPTMLDRTLALKGLRPRDVDVVVGGPPCQGFSSAGKKSETDPRNTLFRHYVRVVEHLRPRIFLMENVPGFKARYGGAIYQEALDAMHALGYQTTDRVIHMKDYGVPQTRKRFVMVGWLPGVEPFQWPGSTNSSSENDVLFGATEPHVSAGDALDDISDLAPGYEATRYGRKATSSFAQLRRNGNYLLFNHLATKHRAKSAALIERIPVGGSIRDLPAETRGTKKLTMSKLHPKQISNTVVSLPDDLLHYAHHRILSVRETARLQTFDDDYVFFGKRTSGFVERRVDVPQYTQVGNAVPPRAAEVLAGALLRSLGAGSGDRRDLARRRERHNLVVGSSGHSGYELALEAVGEIEVRTVFGDVLALPVASDLPSVSSQPAKRDWTVIGNPKRGQWSPGVEAKGMPSWMASSA